MVSWRVAIIKPVCFARSSWESFGRMEFSNKGAFQIKHVVKWLSKGASRHAKKRQHRHGHGGPAMRDEVIFDVKSGTWSAQKRKRHVASS